MNEVTPEEWCARLRDPKSKQAHDTLRSDQDPAAFCCLGHLADLIDPDGWTVHKDGNSLWLNYFGYLRDDAMPDWLTNEAVDNAVSLNDVEMKTLSEIADWVESAIIVSGQVDV